MCSQPSFWAADNLKEIQFVHTSLYQLAAAVVIKHAKDKDFQPVLLDEPVVPSQMQLALEGTDLRPSPPNGENGQLAREGTDLVPSPRASPNIGGGSDDDED
jgi:hypothetical protein